MCRARERCLFSRDLNITHIQTQVPITYLMELRLRLDVIIHGAWASFAPFCEILVACDSLTSTSTYNLSAIANRDFILKQ
jgi:hypothetical protein